MLFLALAHLKSALLALPLLSSAHISGFVGALLSFSMCVLCAVLCVHAKKPVFLILYLLS